MADSPIESHTIIPAMNLMRMIHKKDRIVAKIRPMPTIYQESFRSLKILSPIFLTFRKALRAPMAYFNVPLLIPFLLIVPSSEITVVLSSALIDNEGKHLPRNGLLSITYKYIHKTI